MMTVARIALVLSLLGAAFSVAVPARAQEHAPSIGMRQLAGEAIPLAVAGLMESVPAGTIEVHVRDFRNQPAAGALLRLGVMRQDQSRESREATTDASGVAVFSGLPTGEEQAYRVNLVDDGATIALGGLVEDSFSGTIENSFLNMLAHLHLTVHVFNFNGGIVNQHTHCQRKPTQCHRIDGVAGDVKANNG